MAIGTMQVLRVDPVQGDVQLSEALKKIQAKAKLVRIGSLPLTELGKLKAYILNFKSLGEFLYRPYEIEADMDKVITT